MSIPEKYLRPEVIRQVAHHLRSEIARQPGSHPPLQAVLFDLDGTLADSYGAITASINHVRGCRGLPPLPEPEVRRFVGRGLEHLLQDTVPGTDVAIDAERYRSHHPSVLAKGTRLLPGVAETLPALKHLGLKLGVCSNKPRDFTRKLLDILGIDVFDVALGPEDVKQMKPAPDMLLEALSRLQVTPGQALYVGDMVIDIRTARAAGLRVWVVPTGSEDRAALKAAEPDAMLESIADLVRAFTSAVRS